MLQGYRGGTSNERRDSMKKRLTLSLVFSIALAFLGTTIAAAPVVVKVGDSTPKTFSYYGAFMTFKKEVEEKTGGKVDIQYFGEGVLGDQKTLMESCMMGALPVFAAPSSVVQSIVPECKIFTLPFVWPSPGVLRNFLDGPDGQQMSALFERHGMKNLAWGYTGEIGIQNRKRAVKSPADMKGLKIRVMPDPIMVETINAMGGMGVAMGLGELYSALQQGVLDGISTSPQLLDSLKIFEVAKFYTPVNMHYTPAAVLVNTKFWSTLSPDIQSAFTEGMKNWVKNNDAYYLNASLKTSNEYILTAFREKGVAVSSLTPSELQTFKKSTVSVVQKYRKEIGPDFVDKVLKFTGYKME
jgi:tripartite ATP-independent transporter DctP family solute receptor